MKLLLPLALCLHGMLTTAQATVNLPEIGVVGRMEEDSLLHAIGFDALTESTQKLLSPREVTDAAFSALLPAIKRLRTPLYACNLFIPADLKVVGPVIDEAAVLAYVEIVFRRAQTAGLTLITWGSSGSRRVPDGFDRLTATAQFIYMGRRVAEVAAGYGIVLALENLNSKECNFITTLPEATAIVRAVDHPNFRLCVDIYHMLVDGQPAADIIGSGPYAVYCEVAEREDRAAPGVRGDDFRPYFRVLRAEGYTGKIAIEARWNALDEEGPQALRSLRSQLRQAFLD